jgi:hypothetical protein
MPVVASVDAGVRGYHGLADRARVWDERGVGGVPHAAMVKGVRALRKRRHHL